MMMTPKSIRELKKLPRPVEVAAVEGAAPCSVEMTTRSVIEHQLLTALGDKSKVAILATKQDLEDLIEACEHNQFRHGLRARCNDLASGMRQLLSEAFPPNSDYATGGSYIETKTGCMER